MFSSTILWQRSFEPQNDSLDQFRARLKEAFLRFRDRASTLAAEISRDAPTLTVHDISHLDALWEMAELIIGEEQISGSEPFLNPLETFILGAAFLTHDLAHSTAALKLSKEDIRQHARYRELLTRYINEKHVDDELASHEATDEDHDETLQAFLREHHAKAAESLLLISWEDLRGQSHFLIADPEIRESLGETIGRVAASHHWSISQLQREFDIVGAPAFMPSSWQCDLLEVASVLRVADVAHIDARRAPSMLAALRKPKFISKRHWDFQNRLNHPVRREDRILYTSTVSFPLALVDAWWLCFDVLNYINRELSTVDSLLLETRRKRFSLKAVVGVEDPTRLARHIPTQGWQPLDTQIRVGNVASLVRKLGGEQLYGDNHLAPIRELIQNACDAIRARRILERLDEAWGQVSVSLFKRETDWILQVTDNGIGMSTAVLTGPLLDFGNSYWSSLEASRELPGLSQNEFKPTGRFGIGFFSVFMLGDRVKVCSRRFDAGVSEARVLEFMEGPDSRPLLRGVSGEEFHSAGTRVEVILSKPPNDRGGILKSESFEIPSGSLAEIVAWLCPCSIVTIVTQEENGTVCEVVRANDWRTLETKKLMTRVEIDEDAPKDEVKRIQERSAPLMKPILGVDGSVLGRACLRLQTRDEGNFLRGSATIAVGGCRAQDLYHLSGVVLGVASRASRDQAFPLPTADDIRKWADEQRRLIECMDVELEVKAHAAKLLRGGGVEVGNLPIAYTNHGWVNKQELTDWFKGFTQIILDETYSIYSSRFRVFKSYLEGVVIVEPEVNGLFPLLQRGKGRGAYDWRDPKTHAYSLTNDVLEALAEAWQTDVATLLANAAHSTTENSIVAPIGIDIYGNPIESAGLDIFDRDSI